MSVNVVDVDQVYRVTGDINMGRNAFSCGMWVRRQNSISDPAFFMGLYSAAEVGYWFEVGIDASNNFYAYTDAGSDSGNFTGSYAAALNTWYYIALTRDPGDTTTGTYTVRVFDDTTSTTPAASLTKTFASVNPLMSVTEVIFGTDNEAALGNLEIVSARLVSGDVWTNTEARAESQSYTFVTGNGTLHGNWQMQDTDADATGINDSSGNNFHLTNSGASNGATTPTQLSGGPAAYRAPAIYQLQQING